MRIGYVVVSLFFMWLIGGAYWLYFKEVNERFKSVGVFLERIRLFYKRLKGLWQIETIDLINYRSAVQVNVVRSDENDEFDTSCFSSLAITMEELAEILKREKEKKIKEAKEEGSSVSNSESDDSIISSKEEDKRSVEEENRKRITERDSYLGGDISDQEDTDKVGFDKDSWNDVDVNNDEASLKEQWEDQAKWEDQVEKTNEVDEYLDIVECFNSN